MKQLILLAALLLLANCSTTTDILEGATHASGIIHVEGYFTDTQGEVRVCKAPEGDDYCTTALQDNP